MISTPVRINDHIGLQITARRFNQYMDTGCWARPADSIADDPPYGIARSNGTTTHQLFAFLQHDVGHLSRRCINLIERAIGIGILLDGIKKPVAGRLDARSLIGVGNSSGGDNWL